MSSLRSIISPSDAHLFSVGTARESSLTLARRLTRCPVIDRHPHAKKGEHGVKQVALQAVRVPQQFHGRRCDAAPCPIDQPPNGKAVLRALKDDLRRSICSNLVQHKKQEIVESCHVWTPRARTYR